MSVQKPTIGEWTDEVIRYANEFATCPEEQRKINYKSAVNRLVRECIEARLRQIQRKHKK